MTLLLGAKDGGWYVLGASWNDPQGRRRSRALRRPDHPRRRTGRAEALISDRGQLRPFLSPPALCRGPSCRAPSGKEAQTDSHRRIVDPRHKAGGVTEVCKTSPPRRASAANDSACAERSPAAISAKAQPTTVHGSQPGSGVKRRSTISNAAPITASATPAQRTGRANPAAARHDRRGARQDSLRFGGAAISTTTNPRATGRRARCRAHRCASSPFAAQHAPRA